jgi:predicted ArsR family transcriptional regulator
MPELGDHSATRTAKVLSLPTRAAILSMLLRSGEKTVKEVADAFKIHPNVARAHLDLMVEAGFLATETRRRAKGRPAKVYFTWEGEAQALSEAGVDVPTERKQEERNELEVELRILERIVADASAQLVRIRELVEEKRPEEEEEGGSE